MPALVVFGLAYMVPLTVFTTYGAVAQTTEGHVPTAYLITLVTMLFTAVSYAVLVRAYPQAGSAYVYARHAFGRHVGFLTGWTLMLDYLLLPLINYLVMGIYLHAQFPSVPGWVFALAGIVVVTALNIVGITLVRDANLLLVGVQLLFAMVFLATAAAHVADHPGTSLLQPLYDAGMTTSGLASGAAVLALSYLGFDAISTMSEEARDPRRTVPRAIVLTTLIGGFVFTIISYAAQLVQPDWRDIDEPDAAAAQIMGIAAGHWLEVFFLVAYISGCVAAAIASQASVARVLYAMGRDRVFPRLVFGTLSARFSTPVGATLVVGFISLAALFSDLGTVASLISFGALAAFSLVNLSVVKHFLIDRKLRGMNAMLHYGVVPVLGFALTGWLWSSLSSLTLTVGLFWFGVGATYLALLTRGFRQPPPAVEFDESSPGHTHELEPTP
ncbi:APC family permease [Streptomyces sp. NPDC015127]|uniref:APC family permease n=1 Tax=Streptomyces sp. NPDC015127 TaxID=3364939 RepID=UPI0037024ABA